MSKEWFEVTADPKHRAAEREKAKQLRQSQWWQNKISLGLCHYCQKKFAPTELTMDHIVPVARGGKSVAGNVVPSCRNCNATKKLETPVEKLLRELAEAKQESQKN